MDGEVEGVGAGCALVIRIGIGVLAGGGIGRSMPGVAFAGGYFIYIVTAVNYGQAESVSAGAVIWAEVGKEV
jgi:hypothetical protein